LQKDPEERLGYNGSDEVLEHPWFSSIDKVQLINKEMDAPYKPVLSEDLMDL